MIRIFENKPILQFKESELLNLFGNGANPYYAKVADALASFNGLANLTELQDGVWYYAPSYAEKLALIPTFNARILNVELKDVIQLIKNQEY